jgi:hypothetical protein
VLLLYGLAVSLILVIPGPSAASGAANTPFTYVGGTESMRYGCHGKVEVAKFALTFECSAGSITIPYRSITHMEYRPQLSRAVRKMKLRWTTNPSGSGGKKKRLFTVLYKKDARLQAIVLKVAPNEMRPYLAVLELHTGKRIDVWDYRKFD